LHDAIVVHLAFDDHMYQLHVIPVHQRYSAGHAVIAGANNVGCDVRGNTLRAG
jgi:hypothetical protein